MTFKPRGKATVKKTGKATVTPPDNFVNKHNAVVTVAYTYDGKPAHPGFVWYCWAFTYFKRTLNKKGRLVVAKCRKVGGVQIEKKFEDEHREFNVKRMVIQNIVNLQERD